MSVASSRKEHGLEQPADWQALPTTESFQQREPAGRSASLRVIRHILWCLLPPLTFIGMVALWWGAVEAFAIPA